MKNPITLVCDYFRKLKEEDRKRSIERMVNHDICVKNDTNDPQSKIYIFIRDVPVSLITNKPESIKVNANFVETEEVADVFDSIKRMYRNYLENKPII